MPLAPHEVDGYHAISNRRYKGRFRNEAWFSSISDRGVLDIDGVPAEKLLVWEFVMDTWRENTESLPGNVTVHFLDDGDPTFRAPGHIHYAGFTDGIPGDVHIHVNRTYVPGGAQFQGMPFLWEILAHEYTHAILINAPTGTLDLIPPLFGKTMDDWDTADWTLSVKEAWCEQVKDWTLARPRRKFDNRTQLAVPRERWYHQPTDDTGIAGFPGAESVWGSDMQQVQFRLHGGGVPYSYSYTRYTQYSLYLASLFGPGNLSPALPFPPVYPYEKVAPDPIPSAISAGAAASGTVQR